MYRSALTHALLAAGVVLMAGVAVAEGLSGAEATQARIEHMKALGAAMKAVSEQLKTGAPDLTVIQTNAARIVDGAAALPTWFPPGSGQEVYEKSRALPVVWSDPAGFKVKADALIAAAPKLRVAAQTGDAAAVTSAFHEVGATCKGCHDTFQAKSPA